MSNASNSGRPQSVRITGRLSMLALLLAVTGCDSGAVGDGNGGGSGSGGSARCATPPVLEQPVASLRDSLVCHTPLTGLRRDPLLLIPGTTLTPEANYHWNYIPALDALGWPYCTVELPLRAMGDIQTAAEHVVYAVREMHRQSGRKVQILGYSQGGMLPRWALKYWPELRPMVSELVSLSASNHGTLTAIPTCQAPCAPAYYQQRADSQFTAALNTGPETWPGIDYTSIYTWADEVVTPNLPPNPSSALAGDAASVRNIAVQELCPTSNPDHLAIGSYDAAAYALAIDALDHDGPADPARLAPTVCAQPFMPGVDPASFATDFAAMAQFIVTTQAAAATVSNESPLRCYATATP